MTSNHMRWLWAPRSVWQIVVVAMAAVLTPFALLLYHTTGVLQDLARDGQTVTEDAIRITQANRTLTASLTDLERIARQYLVIGDSAQRELFETSAARFQSPLEEIMAYVRHDALLDVATSIQIQLQAITEHMRAATAPSTDIESQVERLSGLQKNVEALTSGTRDRLREAMLKHSEATAEARRHIINTSLLLVPLTVLMIVGFTVIIVRPIRHLHYSVRTLGQDDPASTAPVTLKGPAEMISLGEELEWLRQRLAEVNEQKQAFLRHVSHELKTPLASIREGTELLREQVVGKLSRGQREVLDLVDDNSRLLQQMIENLLQASRLEGPEQHYPEKFSLARLADELLRYHSLSIANHGIYVCIGGPPLRLFTDRRKVHTVLDNLLSNAIAYGEIRGRIWIEWHQTAEGLIIDVANTGQPIAEADRDMIFEPFYQGRRKRQGAVKGSGVGLAVARQSAVRLGGSLTLQHHPIAATCFRVQLPPEVIIARDT